MSLRSNPTPCQPLAAYRAAGGFFCRETIFDATVTAEDVIASARHAMGIARRANGFRLMLFLHDGTAIRALAFWETLGHLTRFDGVISKFFHTIVPDSPDAFYRDLWTTGVAQSRVGEVAGLLIGPSVPVPKRDIVIWEPPAAARIVEMAGIRDITPLRAWAVSITDLSHPLAIQRSPGFQMIVMIDFGDGDCAGYVVFRTPQDLDTYQQSERLGEYNRRLTSVIDLSDPNVRAHTSEGTIHAWFVRDFSAPR